MKSSFVGQSISPAVHNRAFQSRRVDAIYLPFLVTPAHLREHGRVQHAREQPNCVALSQVQHLVANGHAHARSAALRTEHAVGQVLEREIRVRGDGDKRLWCHRCHSRALAG